MLSARCPSKKAGPPHSRKRLRRRDRVDRSGGLSRSAALLAVAVSVSASWDGHSAFLDQVSRATLVGIMA